MPTRRSSPMRRRTRRGSKRIHASLGAFAAAMYVHARTLPNNSVLQFTDAIALTLLRGLVLDTPRRTGRAAGNWQTTVGNPASGALGIRSASSAISEGARVLGEQRTWHAPVYLTNNLPYILPLEGGHSPQKPGGFIAVNIKRVTAGLRPVR